MNPFKVIKFKPGSDFILKDLLKALPQYQKQAEQAVNDFAKQNKVSLPQDFKDYLIELETVVAYFKTKADSSDSQIWEYIEHLAFPAGNYKDIFGIGDLYSLDKRAIYSSLEFFKNEGQGQYLPIANNGAGDYLVISLSGSDTGQLFKWNHEYPEDDEQKIEPVTDSFKLFIQGLK